MEFDIRFPGTDPTERRRLQNRLAQRKFRRSSSRSNASSTPQRQVPVGNDAATSNFVSPLTCKPNPNNFLISTSDSTGHLGFNPDNVNFADLDAMDHFFSGVDMSIPPGDISPAPALPTLGQDFDFSPSSSSSETSPPSSASMNHPAHFQGGGEVAIPNLARTPSIIPQVQQQSLIPYETSTSTGANRPAALPPPYDQPLYESRPEETLRILSTASPAEALDGWLGTLHIAAQKGHDGIIRTLLQHGNVDCNERDSDGRTPLMYAVIEGHEPVVRLLLSHGARIAEVDRDRRSALHLAVLHRRESVLDLLLAHGEQGLSIDDYDVAGWTPLHMAIERNFEAGLALLLQSGANLHSKARKCPFTGKVAHQ